MKRGRRKSGTSGQLAVSVVEQPGQIAFYGPDRDVYHFGQYLADLRNLASTWEQVGPDSYWEWRRMIGKDAKPLPLSKVDWLAEMRNSRGGDPLMTAGRMQYELFQRLLAVISMPARDMEAFFKKLANFVSSEQFGTSRAYDPPRWALLKILEWQYRWGNPVPIVEVVSEVFRRSGVAVSERWVSDEVKKMGFSPRRRGRVTTKFSAREIEDWLKRLHDECPELAEGLPRLKSKKREFKK